MQFNTIGIHRYVLLILTAIAIAFSLIAIFEKKESRHQSPYCETRNCIYEANTVLSTMNLSADPCTDFNNYVCGNSINYFQLNPGSTILGTSSKLIMEKYKHLFHAITRYDVAKRFNSTAMGKLQTFVKSCFDISPMQDMDTTTITDLIRDLGGWTILSSPDIEYSTWKLSNVEATANNMGFFQFMQVSWSSRPYNGSNGAVTLQISRQNWFFYHTEDDTKFAVMLANFLGKPESKEKIEKKLDDIKNLFESIANKKYDFEANMTEEDKNRKIWTASELHNYVSNANFDFLTYMKKALKNDKVTGYLNVLINYSQRSFLKALGYFSKTKQMEMANFITLNVVKKLLNKYPRVLFKSNVNGNLNFGEIDYQTPQWYTCLSLSIQKLRFPIGVLHAELFDNKKSIEKTIEITKRIKESYIRVIQSSSFFSPGTKQRTIKRIKEMKETIGYPSYLFDKQLLDNTFKELHFKDNNFLWNYIKVLEFNRKHEIETNFKMPDKGDMDSPWLDVVEPNAFYWVANHEIVVLPGLIASPNFDIRFSIASNLGVLGFVIGHEISHSLMPNFQATWFNDDKFVFDKKLKCFLDQYRAYLPSQHQNTTFLSSMSEIVADNLSMQVILETFQKMTSDSHKPGILLGAGLTQDQLLFVGHARWGCETFNEEYTPSLSHPPNHIRVLGMLSNSKAFAKAFNCSFKSRYNPSKKCTFW